MKTLKICFFIFGILFVGVMAVAFWAVPSYRARMGIMTIPIGISIHGVLTIYVLLLYLEVTNKKKIKTDS
jgi:hypothetical protein